MKSLLISWLLILGVSAQAYQELATYANIKLENPGLKKWVIFDIDNTLIRPSQVIGSVEWVEYMRERYIQAGYSKEAASQKQHELFSMTQLPNSVQVVDASIGSFLSALPSHARVFGLTARNQMLTQMTILQLGQVNLMGALETRPPTLKQKPADLHWERGIVFANGQDKGEILEKILSHAETEPEEIIFFDDKVYNVEAFDRAMEKINSIRTQKIRYQSYFLTAANRWVKSFDAKAADRAWYQFRYLNRVWSSDVLRDPVHLARQLWNEQSPMLGVNIEKVACEPESKTGDLLTMDCAYQRCESWITGYDESYCSAISPKVEHVYFELQYLTDLGIYIRSNWNFLM